MVPATLERRRRPAVSTRIVRRPSTSSSVSIASRVVPARSETITRSDPRKALTSEDLPALGRPITATRVGCSPSPAGALSPSSSTTRSSRSPLPRPCVAETANGSPSPSLWSSAVRCSSSGRSTLLATARTGTSAPPPGAGVGDQDHEVGLGHPDTRLPLDVAGQFVIVGEVDPTGVEQVEGDPVPLAAHPLAVARNSGLGVGDRLPPASQAVDQGALADVGEA